MVYEVGKGETVEKIFAGWNETIIWSCLQGVMGHIYADDIEKPASAMAVLGDFCFFAGQPDKELAEYIPECCKQDFMIAVPQNHLWADVIEKQYGGRAKKAVRYAMKKEQNAFDRNKLDSIVRGLSPEYSLSLIDEKIFAYCKEEDWCRDLVSQFADWQTYQRIGLGAAILKDGVPVSGASSYSTYLGGICSTYLGGICSTYLGGSCAACLDRSYPACLGGIEVEIDTRKEYRRRGLAGVCGAKLILECLDRGLYPSWDAQSLWSVSLAEKLGYHFDYEYTAYEIYG